MSVSADGVWHPPRTEASRYPQARDETGGLSTRDGRVWKASAWVVTLWCMTLEIPPYCRSLIAGQGGVISRSQGAEFGLAGEQMRNRVRFADWQRVQRGVYATFSGDLGRESQLWAVLLRAGPDAVLSHQTAAELYGLIKQPSSLIHLTVPHISNPARYSKIPGVVVHRSRILEVTRHPALLPARTRLEHTVLDLIADMDDPADRYDLICRAIGSRRNHLRAAMAGAGQTEPVP